MSVYVRFAAACFAMIFAHGAHAQSNSSGAGDYPSQPVKIIVPFSPGGLVDVMARLMADGLSKELGQTFYVDNHGGASGNIGAAAAQRSAPDGHTIMITSSSFLVNPGFQKVPYDPYGFEPITILSASPSILVVNPDFPAKDVKGLIALIKKAPGKYNFASTGTGSTPHLLGEMFKTELKLDMVHVPFKGGGPALQATAGGHTPIAFAALPPAIPLIKTGRLHPIAIIAPERIKALPDVPTLKESGETDLDARTVLLVMAPKGTSKAIVDKLNSAFIKVSAQPAIEERFEAAGFSRLEMTPQEAAGRIKNDLEMWAKVIRDAKITR